MKNNYILKNILFKIKLLKILKKNKKIKKYITQLTSKLIKNKYLYINIKRYKSVFFIFNIHFNNSNIIINITDSNGFIKLINTSGLINFNGSEKTKKYAIIQIIKHTINQIKIFKYNYGIIHYKGIKKNYYKLIIKYLKKNFIIKAIKYFNLLPHNGCRPKKLKRLKYKKYLEEMTEWLIVIDCKSIGISFVGSNPTFFIRNITQLVAYLFWEQEVMCSNHIISTFFNTKN